jgi:hypothetical protein
MVRSMTEKRSDSDSPDNDARPNERPKKAPDGKVPGPAKEVGDETPNPLPDNPNEGDGGGGAGGDPGRA